MQQEIILRLGSCLIGIYSDIQLVSEEETKDFIVKTNEKPVYTYRFLKVNKIVVPQNVPCIQWGQWWIYQPGDRECHIRRTDDGDNIPYMSFYQTGEKEYCVEYLPMIESHLGINRFTLSFMALEARMLEQQGLILHCSFVKYKDYGILFSAPSGTGKSTQADLWAKYRECEIINGDRALIQKQGDDFFVYGWPICGSSKISRNSCVPIKAIVQLNQGKENVVTIEDRAQRMKKLIPEITVNRWNIEAYMKALDLMEELEQKVTIIRFDCNISENAVDTLESYLFP